MGSLWEITGLLLVDIQQPAKDTGLQNSASGLRVAQVRALEGSAREGVSGLSVEGVEGQ